MDSKSLLSINSMLTIDQVFKCVRIFTQLFDENEIEGRDYLIRLLSKVDFIPSQGRKIIAACIESAGLYPYLQLLGVENYYPFSTEKFRSPFLKDIILHEDQFKVSITALAKKNVALSAPTSFGKSLLIQEIVSSNIYKNIVILQPTLALLDETREKLVKYLESYNLIVSTADKPEEGRGNIFLFTPERAVEYKTFPPIDFFVVDEFYKLSPDRNDERMETLNFAFYKLLKIGGPKFYLLGPSINNIPEIAIKSLNINFFKTEFSTVSVSDQMVIDASSMNFEKKCPYLFKLLTSIKGQTLVYCSSPEGAIKLSKAMCEHGLGETNEDKEVNYLKDWISKEVSADWSLVKLLGLKIAFHHGQMPRHLSNTIVDFFNRGLIKYLFCTSTLIEGVNTSAENVILFDNTKGRKKYDYFDFKNIVGRSGRMFQYFVGNVYRFYPEPIMMNFDVDIPFLTQSKASEELLIQMEEKDLNPESKKKLTELKVDKSLLETFRKNVGISLHGQDKLFTHLMSCSVSDLKLLQWTGIPKYKELEEVIRLAWDFLIEKKGSLGSVRSYRQLSFLTFKYYQTKSINALLKIQLESDYYKKLGNESVDTCVKDIFGVLRRWFDFKLPKLIMTVSSIQQAALAKRNLPIGNYTVFSTLLENSFVDQRNSSLLDYNLPPSLIRALNSSIKFESVKELRKVLSSGNEFSKLKSVHPYELYRLKKFLVS